MRYFMSTNVQKLAQGATRARDRDAATVRATAQPGTPRRGASPKSRSAVGSRGLACASALLLAVACGQATRNHQEGNSSSTVSSSTVSSTTSATASSHSSGSSVGGSGAGGSGTGGSGTGGSGAGMSGTGGSGAGGLGTGGWGGVKNVCESDDDCSEGEECYISEIAFSVLACGPARPECDPLAGDDACTCDTVSSAVLVSGEGESCEVLSEEVTACYWQYGACLDACVPAYYRYDLGDGTALIVRAYQGEMPPGWLGDGQGQTPASCPAVESSEME